ncbi:MAG: hypothetical protein BSOLF_0666 [Candidatus Carbobacillus altaicus]|uniref:Uncharacterized protein n=1 Tax=Candidatus Carbonibacillus altaicus TaxID=2163959 RepID=A0A2R6Y569_9BACL|nr:MAG: hypothetical protein BSOLF_0666 [Candidatus Carbobacillus altaicus]
MNAGGIIDALIDQNHEARAVTGESHHKADPRPYKKAVSARKPEGKPEERGE